jgi:hypothetical protein
VDDVIADAAGMSASRARGWAQVGDDRLTAIFSGASMSDPLSCASRLGHLKLRLIRALPDNVDTVMRGHSASEDARNRAGVPRIHAFLSESKASNIPD